MGEYQIGALLLNLERIQIEDNTLRVRSDRFSDNLDDWVNNATARSRMIDAIIGQASISGEPERPWTVRVDVSDRTVYFASPFDQDFWNTLIEVDPPARVSSSKVLLDYLKRSTNRMLLGGGNENLRSILRQWLTQEFTRYLPTAAQGIVIGGRVATEVRVRDNTIQGAIQGIHIGLSDGRRDIDATRTAGRVLVESNTIGIVLPVHGLRERHGIFLGSCESAAIERNYVTVDASARSPGLRTPIDGIRIVGTLGRRILVRENHLEGCTTGVLFHPRNEAEQNGDNGGDNIPVLWWVNDNVMPGAVAAVDSLHPHDLEEPDATVQGWIQTSNNSS
jgi:hypothetical protein